VDDIYNRSPGGRVTFHETVIAPLKLFMIDDPTDPANKYLSHSCVESSDMKNIYDGIAILDGSGEAIVEFPEWFEALNGDFRYQVTPIDGGAPHLHIAEKISAGRFKIAGGKEGMEVSWQITGTRKDKVAEANPLVVQKEKPASERGFYLHPELYGESEERSIVRAKSGEQRQRVEVEDELRRRTEDRRLVEGHRRHMAEYVQRLKERAERQDEPRRR
jgi:hypothetical protein